MDVKVTNLPVNDDVLKALPPTLDYLREDFSPSGPLTTTFRFRRGEGRPACHEWIFEPQGMAGSYKDFIYPLHDVRGTIYVDASAAPLRNIRLDLSGQGPQAKATLKGTLRGEKKTGPVDLQIAAVGVPLDQHLMAALPERVREVARQFLPKASRDIGLARHPMGKGDVRAEFHRAVGESKFRRHFHLTIRDASVLYDQFPYPLENVTGVLELFPDHWECKDVRGQHAGGEILLNGRSFCLPSASGVRGALPVNATGKAATEKIQVDFIGKNVLLDEEFERALRPISGSGRQGLQTAWKSLRLSGRMNFSAKVIDHAESPQDIDVKVSMQGPSARPTFFNYALEGVGADVSYSRGQVQLTDLRARHGPADVALQRGVIQVGADGGFNAWLFGLTARSLVTDAELLAALPESLRKVLEALRLKTPIEAAAKLTLVNPPGAARPLEVWWEGALGLEHARFKAGVDVAEATGQFFCKGYHDGQRLRGASCQLRLKQAKVFDQPLTNLACRLDVEPSAPDVLRVRDLKADLFGGTVHGQGRLESSPVLKYDLLLEAVGVQLEAFGRYNLGPAARAAQLQGPARAAIHLSGQGTDLLGLKGNGRVDVADGKMGQLPVLLDLVKAFGLRLPDRTAFEQAHVVFAVEGPQLLVRQLELIGNAVSLNGQGRLDVDGSNVELDFTATPGRFTQILPTGIDAIPPLLSGQLLRIKMRGKFGGGGKVKLDKEIMPGVLDPIRRVFEGGS